MVGVSGMDRWREKNPSRRNYRWNWWPYYIESPCGSRGQVQGQGQVVAEDIDSLEAWTGGTRDMSVGAVFAGSSTGQATLSLWRS